MNTFGYFTEVEEAFVRRRGQQLFISSKDWALIEHWKDRGIPLHVAIRGIEDVFDTRERSGNLGKVSTLSYCSSAIEEGFLAWSASQVGASTADYDESTFSRASIQDHIDTVLVALAALRRPEIVEDVQIAIYRLAELRRTMSDDPEAVDRSLADIEAHLDTAMLTHWNPKEFDALEYEVQEQLKGYKSAMEEDAYNNTASLMLLKKLREVSGIPRMSLFYL